MCAVLALGERKGVTRGLAAKAVGRGVAVGVATRVLETCIERGWLPRPGSDHIPVVGSTKSLSGHSLGAAGVQEAIYSLLMQQKGFIAASANIETLDPEAEGLPIATGRQDDVDLVRVMSNSFGFGGTNASLVFQKYSG